MTRSQTERPQIYTDPLTNQTVVRPSPWATMGSAQQVAQQAPQQAAQMPQRQQAIARQSDVTQVQPLLMDEQQAVSESPYKAPAELGARGKVMEAESAQRIAEKYAEADYNQKLKLQKESFDDLVMNEGAIPLIDQMIKMNRQTIDAPYADLLQAGTRFLASDQADAFDIVNQNRLELAAPLAKALGVNPTDKDFEASLNRIVNLNSTKSGREKQLQNLRKRTLEKIKKSGGQAKTPSTQEKPEITKEQALQMLKERGRL